MTKVPEFPPLLTGLPLPAAADVMAEAIAAAPTAEPGTVYYAEDDDIFRAALILAPDRSLEDAASVAFVPLLAMNDALGALAPPEVGVHVEWPFTIRVNGATAGQLKAVAPSTDAKAEPSWLVLSLSVTVRDPDPDPGTTPDRTTLADEGCADLIVADLIEAWARHTMLWLHTYLSEGFAPIARGVTAIVYRRGEEVSSPGHGTFLGLDEAGGMLLKTPDGTRTLPLHAHIQTG